MVTMEFDDFVRQFRERTAQRMVEFEKALAKAQADMEKSPRAGKPATTAPGRKPGSGEAAAAADRVPPPVVGAKKTPARHRRRSGPVQGVLKK